MELKKVLDYQAGKIAAQDIIKNDNGQSTLLAFDEGATIARHQAPGDALVLVVEGTVVFDVEGQKCTLNAGDYLSLSAGTPHEVYAETKAKVLLTIIKTTADKPEAKEPFGGLLDK